MVKAIEYSLKAEKREFKQVKITSSAEASAYARNFYHEDICIYESSFIMLQNNAGYVIGYAKISQGGVSSTIIDARIVAKYAIDTLASGVIIVHNHPSGEVDPSNQDIDVMKNLKSVLNMLDVKLLDSIILTDSDSLSMADLGYL